MAVDVNQGAIGYAEMTSTAGAPATKYPNVDQVLIDGHGPDPQCDPSQMCQ
jgi:hypothetical protein